MSCRYYEEGIGFCGLCFPGSDFFDAEQEPTGQYDDMCADPDDDTCTHFEGEN